MANPRFAEILTEMKKIHDQKNADYAGFGENALDNLRLCEAAGIPAWKGAVVRMSDKLARIFTFCRKESLEVKSETIIDTLTDLANYAILTRILYEETLPPINPVEDAKRYTINWNKGNIEEIYDKLSESFLK